MPNPLQVDILVVDDNANNLRSLEALLRDVDAHIVQARSGEEALRQLLRREFALVLLDIQMPNVDGFETARLIRSRERNRHLPIIFLTALNRSEVNVVRGYALGAVDFLFKPLVPEILRSKVSIFLDLHRKRHELQRQEELLRDAERRDNERRLEETRQKYERTLLEQQMERERKVKEALGHRADELSRLVEERTCAQRRLQLLADVANRLLLAPSGAQREAYRQTVEHLGLDIHLEFRVAPGRKLRLTSHSGTDEAAVQRFDGLPFGQGIAGTVADARSRIIVEDIASTNDSRDQLARDLGLAAAACFPLVAHDALLGAVTFASQAPRRFSLEEIALMQGLCDQVAVSLERDELIEQLRERDRRKDEFLAMLAHELRNPMAPIRSAIEVLQAGKLGDARLERAVGSADRQISHMARLVDDLLDVSRITRGKVELRKERVLLSAVVEQAVAATEPILSERRQALAVALPPEPIALVVDATRITQVLANLLNNAAKYTDPGGQIRVSAGMERGELAIRVRDNGIGISPEMLPKIFDIFVQVEPTSDRANGGLGLGLTLVKSLVEMHHGRVEAHSDGLPGKGSEFVVRLPLTKDPGIPAPAASAEERGESPHKALDILLVEDNADIRSTLRDLLEMHGHRVTEAYDGPTGVELALLHHPNVALVDIGLPGLDGYGVAERIRASADGGGPRLVALTGYGNPEDQQRAHNAGFDAHLVKPVSFVDLSKVLERLC